jgi:16S rRNA (guanine966-N2)-methyltransferase
MRVVAGYLGGRRLISPPSKSRDVRPTSDRARETIFSILGGRLEGLSVLDLYCGTGALAIEALSRGASQATLIDRDVRPALGNVRNLKLHDRVDLVRSDPPKWLGQRGSDGGEAQRFDLIFIDPPYKLADRLGPELDPQLPQRLARGGRVIVESSARRPLELSLPVLRERRYGSTLVVFYGEGES